MRQSSKRPVERLSYWEDSRRPFSILVFLFPLIVAYEICLVRLLRSQDGFSIRTVEAHRQLLQLFDAAGINPATALHFGGAAVIIILLAWIVIARDRWQVRPTTLAAMVAESVVLAVPLLALNTIVTRTLLPAAAAAGTAGPPGGTQSIAFADLDIASQMAISVGAGIYEELLFRMMLMALVHTVAVDVARLSERTGIIFAVILSAAAFTPYHDLSGEDGALSPARIIFYALAGAYFACVYWFRGFGVVVGAHAAYDLLTVVLSRVD